MSLLQHLEELRRRLLWSLLAFLLAFFACWGFAPRIYSFLARPIYAVLPEGERLVYLAVTDPFLISIKVALLGAAFAASPFILFQLWGFVAPGLYRREKLLAGPFIVAGSLLFLAGGAFGYTIAFPFAADFLITYGQRYTPALEASLTINFYLGFLMKVVLGLGLMFELPTLIFFFAKMGLVTPRFLLRNFRWAVLIIFFVAAVITPTPDVVNLCIFALPTLALYLVGIGVAALVVPRERSSQPSSAQPAAEEE